MFYKKKSGHLPKNENSDPKVREDSYDETPSTGGRTLRSYGFKPSASQFENRYVPKDVLAGKANPNDDGFNEEFLKDWKECITFHQGQQEVIDAFFVDECDQIFMRMGRKAAKTTTIIAIVWRFAFLRPRSTTYICLPTIEQGIEIYWDEQRLQWCNRDDPYMHDKYIKKIDEKRKMITFVNGSTVKLIGTWSEARGRGTQPDLFIADEIQDCRAEYLDAMEPNLAAKEGSRLVMGGTPPKKKNHYHEWEDRIRKNTEKGRCFTYSSYVNTALPHLKGWLDKKKEELYLAGKEDVWLREYMALDCFRSDERLLPDITLSDRNDLLNILRLYGKSRLKPWLSLEVQKNRLTATWGVFDYNQDDGFFMASIKCQKFENIWDVGYEQIAQEMRNTCTQIQGDFNLLDNWFNIVSDETKSFADVIPGFNTCRKEPKWQDRGIPLLREMIKSGKILVSEECGQAGMEAQGLLKEDNILDFPVISTLAVVVNERFATRKLTKEKEEHYSKYEGLKELGIPVPKPPRKRGMWSYP